MDDELQILVVDDNSESIRRLNDVLSGIDGVEVAGTANTIRMAKAKLRQKPVDIVLLNIEMPAHDSLAFLWELKTTFPDVEVVTMAEPVYVDTKRIVEALEMGALEHVNKFSANGAQSETVEFRLRMLTLLGLVRGRKNVRDAQSYALQETPAVETPPDVPEPVQTGQGPEAASVFDRLSAIGKACMLQGRIDVVAIAASTGGPNALMEVISKLPANLDVPILLVQHMPSSLTASLADSLNAKSKLLVREAVDGEPVLPNVVHLAPGGQHMFVRQRKSAADATAPVHIGLNQDPPENSVRPAADVLFRSLAREFHKNILAVIMTGMGNDGMLGVTALKKNNCYCLAQSADTCVVYGMPRAVDEADLSDEKVPLDQIAERIVSIVKGTGITGNI